MEAQDPVVIAFLRLLQALRVEQRLTLEELADKAGIHRTTVGLLERAERTPSILVAAQLSNALGHKVSDLLAKAELIADGKLVESQVFAAEQARQIDAACLRNLNTFEAFTGMPAHRLMAAIQGTYRTLDMIDDQLLSGGSPPIAGLVELANLSSMVGNLVARCIAEESDGLYERNRPHQYPDLLALRPPAQPLELKMALETNKPKGHLPKPGRYLSFRYVLGDRFGHYARGKDQRGQTVWIWEVRAGTVGAADFSVSNTEGDSGKTAVIRTEVFNAMTLVFFDHRRCPYPMRNGTYPGLN